jgi:hypothetical protein
VSKEYTDKTHTTTAYIPLMNSYLLTYMNTLHLRRNNCNLISNNSAQVGGGTGAAGGVEGGEGGEGSGGAGTGTVLFLLFRRIEHGCLELVLVIFVSAKRMKFVVFQ